MIRTSVLLAVLILIPVMLLAQAAAPKLVGTTKVMNLTRPENNAAQKNLAGDTLLVRLTYKNEGTSAAANAAVTAPIDPGQRLVPKSWTTKECTVLFSTDSAMKTFAPYPLKMEVVNDKGKKVEMEVPLEKYTAAQFKPRKPIKAGETAVFEFKAVVR
jgi:uncharacterized repeat protein (TIGR01451 family)